MGPDQFVALYRSESEAVAMFLTRRTLDAEVALELTAETFAQAWRSRRTLRATTREERRAWLFAIARRCWARWLERGRVERHALQRLGVQLPTFHEDDLDAVERRAGLPALRAALGARLEQLNADQRAALHLRIVEERDYADVAARLDVTEATARARVSRGLRALAAADWRALGIEEGVR